MYHNGEGVTQDDTEADIWYGKAAEQGHARAQFSLGLSFRDGQGVPQDDVEAYTWFDLAAGRSSGDGEKATYATARDILAKTMTADQVAEAQKRTRWWLEGFERRQRMILLMR
jgi:TPR repeat protein